MKNNKTTKTIKYSPLKGVWKLAALLLGLGLFIALLVNAFQSSPQVAEIRTDGSSCTSNIASISFQSECGPNAYKASSFKCRNSDKGMGTVFPECTSYADALAQAQRVCGQTCTAPPPPISPTPTPSASETTTPTPVPTSSPVQTLRPTPTPTPPDGCTYERTTCLNSFFGGDCKLLLVCSSPTPSPRPSPVATSSDQIGLIPVFRPTPTPLPIAPSGCYYQRRYCASSFFGGNCAPSLACPKPVKQSYAACMKTCRANSPYARCFRACLAR